MPKRTDKPTKALQELTRVLEEALRAGVDSVELEWEGRDLMAFQCLGPAAVGTAPFPKELEVAVLEELVQRAGLDSKTKGTMRLPLLGQEREVMVKQRENFGETAFTITLKTAIERRRAENKPKRKRN